MSLPRVIIIHPLVCRSTRSWISTSSGAVSVHGRLHGADYRSANSDPPQQFQEQYELRLVAIKTTDNWLPFAESIVCNLRNSLTRVIKI